MPVGTPGPAITSTHLSQLHRSSRCADSGQSGGLAVSQPPGHARARHCHSSPFVPSRRDGLDMAWSGRGVTTPVHLNPWLRDAVRPRHSSTASLSRSHTGGHTPTSSFPACPDRPSFADAPAKPDRRGVEVQNTEHTWWWQGANPQQHNHVPCRAASPIHGPRRLPRLALPCTALAPTSPGPYVIAAYIHPQNVFPQPVGMDV